MVLVGIAGFAGVVGFSGGFSEWTRLRSNPDFVHEGSLFCDPSPIGNPGADCAVLLATSRLSAPYRARLKSLARSHGVEGDFGFVDFDENPYRYMKRAGLLALSSRWEGLPGVILEALACGTPVVSTDTPYGPREILGGFGDLPPVGDAPALARALVATLRGERPTEEALRAHAADFSPEKAADAYLALFGELAR